MARGQEEKEIIKNKIFEMFPDSFEYEKVIRIPINDVEIKVALTCAKDNVKDAGISIGESKATPSAPVAEPTEEEIQNVRNLMSKLNL